MRGMCISTAWNKIDRSTMVDVPKFPVNHCSVRYVLGIPAVYFCSAESHNPELG